MRLIDAHSARVSIRAVSDCIVLSCDWLNGYKAGLDAAVAAIDEIPTIEAEPVATDTNVGSKWIPVTERLPESTGSYIVCTDNGAVCTARYYYDLPMGLRYEEPHWNNRNMRRHITHWMPLPEPPKMDGGAE